jgi:hypothetical protein
MKQVIKIALLLIIFISGLFTSTLISQFPHVPQNGFSDMALLFKLFLRLVSLVMFLLAFIPSIILTYRKKAPLLLLSIITVAHAVLQIAFWSFLIL